MSRTCVHEKCYDRCNYWNRCSQCTVRRTNKQHLAHVADVKGQSTKSQVHTMTNYLNSCFLYPATRFRKGTSQANSLISLMPPRSSWSNFALLSVHSMAFRRVWRKNFTILLCIGIRMMKTAKPARALGPRLERRKPRNMPNWITTAQDIWKVPQQKSIRETSVEMWLINLPLDSLARAPVVRRREREYIAVIRPPRIRTPDEIER